ncbi:hypothetical protein AURDEDRAFT_20835, partial [Auricularia subglabra TFB-10046 SS5]
RNLVVCIDGTSNQFSIKNTNVVELYSRLEKSDEQLTFYNSGIGTYAKPSWKSWGYYKQVVANKLDLAFALRFEKIIISAYAWLVDNYQAGDRIFLFGFSRGAYQVRALSAMIETVGLLHKGNDNQIPFAYELYAASNVQDTVSGSLMDRIFRSRGVRLVISHTQPLRKPFRGIQRILHQDNTAENPMQNVAHVVDSGASLPPTVAPQSLEDPTSFQDRFRETFSREVRVHFVGAWDTVSSVGFIRGKALPKTTDGMEHVCYFRHALALHEYRVKFLPEYAKGGDGPG